jgi:hypothetical protein
MGRQWGSWHGDQWRGRTWWPYVAVVGLAVVGVTGPATSAGAASISPTQARSIVLSALTATANAPSLSVRGNGTSGKQTLQFNLTVGAAAAAGSIVMNGQKLEIRRVGLVLYEKATKGYLTANGASASAAASVANKWLSVPASDKSDYAALEEFLYVKKFISGLTPTRSVGKVTGATRTSLGGKPVYEIHGTFRGAKATVYVAAQGTPYVIRLVQPSGSDQGTIYFSNYGQPVNVQIPPNAIPQ